MATDDRPTTAAQSVNLTDRIPWQWYLVTAAVPILGSLIGFIAGIVFMARSKIGPALALWATSFLAATVWSTLGWLVLISWVLQDVSSSARIPALIEPAEEDAAETDEQPIDVQPDTGEPGQDSSRAPGADQNRSQATRSCGNLTASAASTTCAFAQNVFYEYWTATSGGENHVNRITAYSPALNDWLELRCDEGDPVVCMTDAGGEVRMPYQALSEYTQEAADSYADSHTVSE